MWTELATAAHPEAEFTSPVSAAAIDEIVSRLGQQVPADLRSLLLETDGMLDEFGGDVVWTAKRIADDNIMFRTKPSFADLYQPFDGLLFFGDNGGGDQFAFVPGDPGAGIVVWEHETDKRHRVADDLADYLRQILTVEGDEWYQAY
ncbi:SMI1/KNR4 family protein [Krasilnikovia sp. M28-CT-15]|uniref:SMI1/KNR4 family protein n=1 Tax=Krasilnikovia sp. M28-CT-15 TaxID=3373540 RepID=UPI003876368B